MDSEVERIERFTDAIMHSDRVFKYQLLAINVLVIGIAILLLVINCKIT